jgi:hypothetical protein
MASVDEKSSNNGSTEAKGNPSGGAFDLDQSRRAALAEVDNAKFSYVSMLFLHQDAT